MLPVQFTSAFSDYSSLYDMLVPKTNLLRQINDLVDFSFIRKELLAKYCSDNGRMAECPIRMFKYLLMKIIYDFNDEVKESLPKKNEDNDLGHELEYTRSLPW